MTALAGDRLNQSVLMDDKSLAFDTIAASVNIYVGAMVSMDSDGHCRPARATASDKVVGVATRQILTQSAGAPSDGGKVTVDRNIQRLGNSASADAITAAHIGRDCFVIDDQTVALTSNAGARPRAGRVFAVDSTGVFVNFAAGPNLRTVVGPLRITDISAASDSAIGVSPIAGKVVEVITVLQGAISVADAVLAPKIGTTAITGAGITVAQSGSAAGDVDRAHPTAANTVAAGSTLKVTTDGASTTTAACDCYFVIEAD